MSRLIDADAFIEYLGLDVEDAREENLGEIVTLEDFDRQPTAYDIEKVVEELEDWHNHYDNGLIVVNEAIDIVKRGGVE